MGLEVTTKEMNIYPVIPDRAPAYLKIQIRPGKNAKKLEDKLFKLPLSDRRVIKNDDPVANPDILIVNKCWTQKNRLLPGS
jgi:hypothetical protein